MIQIENRYDVGQFSDTGNYGAFTVDFVASDPNSAYFFDKEATEILTLAKVTSIPIQSHLVKQDNCFLVGVADSYIFHGLDLLHLKHGWTEHNPPNRVVFVCYPPTNSMRWKIDDTIPCDVLNYEQIDILPQHVRFTDFALSYANESLEKLRKLHPEMYQKVIAGKPAPAIYVDNAGHALYHRIHGTLKNRNHHALKLPYYRVLAAYCESIGELPGTAHTDFINSEWFGVTS